MGKLDLYNKHWVGIPYALSVLTTGDSFLILYHIIRHSRESVSNKPVLFSKRKLAKLIGRSRNVVDKNIHILELLNLVNVTGEAGGLSSFVINWAEIEFINMLTSKITDDGWICLRSMCLKQNSIVPLSSLSKDLYSDVEQKYSNANIIVGGSNSEPGGSKNEPLWERGGSKNEPGGSISEHRYKYINNNINDNEHSSFNIGEEKKNKIREWFNSRDLSFPALSSDDFYSIFSLPDFNNDNISKTIRLVWERLDYDENSQNNFIPAELFIDILFRSWTQLKEDDSDFSLSEQDIKNIFAFDLIEHEGELCCVITPSKIKNIMPETTRTSRNNKSKVIDGRTSRNIFIDCVKEIGSKDDKLLTDAEFAIQLMIDYIQDTSGEHSAIINKTAYNELLNDFSEQSKIPVNNLRELWCDLPQKGKVTLSPTRLSIQKIIDYNAAAGQESEVEKLYNAKMAESQT